MAGTDSQVISLPVIPYDLIEWSIIYNAVQTVGYGLAISPGPVYKTPSSIQRVEVKVYKLLPGPPALPG